VAPSIYEKFNALGFNFEESSENKKIIDSSGKHITEIDILLENGDIVIAVEVKAKPAQKDVDEHVGRLEILRRRADVRKDTRKFRGAIAGAIMNEAVRDYAHKTGFYVIEQTGDTVKISIPEGFTPREW
jgi:predicted RecB family endonuclease